MPLDCCPSKRTWRRKRLASTPPKGTRWCQLCLRARPESAFHYNYGERAICYSCYEQKRAHSTARAAWRREVWRKKPENRTKVYERYREFVTEKKPWMWRFYTFRRLVDEALQYGGQQARAALEGVPHFRYDQRCKLCGSTDNLQAFWPDYSRPQTIWRFCPYHRKIEAFGDTRTLAQQEREAAKGREVIARIRKLLRDAGVTGRRIEKAKRKAP